MRAALAEHNPFDGMGALNASLAGPLIDFVFVLKSSRFAGRPQIILDAAGA